MVGYVTWLTLWDFEIELFVRSVQSQYRAREKKKKKKIMGTGSLCGIVQRFPDVLLTDCDGNGADVLVCYVFDGQWGLNGW